MNKLVSVVVPVYKVPETLLVRCIKSVLNQTYKKLELILVDDGSPDNCPNICDEYAKSDKRVIVIHQKNMGLAGARNSGQKISKGYYITFLDGDDYFEKEGLEKLCSYAESNDYDLIRGMFYKDYGNNNIVEMPCNDISLNYHYKDSEIIELKKNTLNFNANISSVCGCLYKLSVLNENKIYNDEKLRQGSEDVEFSFRVYDYIKSAIIVPVYFYHYVYNDNSISTVSTDENNYRVLKCFDKIYSSLEEITDLEIKKKMFDAFYIRMLYVVVTSVISGYFNPNYDLSMNERKKKMNRFLKEKIVKDALKFKFVIKMDIKRIIILILIKCRFFLLLKLLGRLRHAEKHF